MGTSVPASRAGDDNVVGYFSGRCARRRKSSRPDRPIADDHRRAAPPTPALQFVPMPFSNLAMGECAAMAALPLYDSPRHLQSAKTVLHAGVVRLFF
jgi:hypothetical protein